MGMQTEISPYDATGYRDEHERLALQRANIMHLVDLKRGGTPRVAQKCGSASPGGRGQFRSYPKVYRPSLDVPSRRVLSWATRSRRTKTRFRKPLWPRL